MPEMICRTVETGGPGGINGVDNLAAYRKKIVAAGGSAAPEG